MTVPSQIKLTGSVKYLTGPVKIPLHSVRPLMHRHVSHSLLAPVPVLALVLALALALVLVLALALVPALALVLVQVPPSLRCSPHQGLALVLGRTDPTRRTCSTRVGGAGGHDKSGGLGGGGVGLGLGLGLGE